MNDDLRWRRGWPTESNAMSEDETLSKLNCNQSENVKEILPELSFSLSELFHVKFSWLLVWLLSFWLRSFFCREPNPLSFKNRLRMCSTIKSEGNFLCFSAEWNCVAEEKSIDVFLCAPCKLSLSLSRSWSCGMIFRREFSEWWREKRERMRARAQREKIPNSLRWETLILEWTKWKIVWEIRDFIFSLSLLFT